MLGYTKRDINLLAAFFTMLIIMMIIYFFKNDIFQGSQYYNYYKDTNIAEKVELRKITAKDELQETIDLASIYEILVAGEKTEKNEIGEIQKIETSSLKDGDIWKIEIPSLNLEAPIAEGTSQDVLAETVGHFEESKLWEGNVALAAHNRGYECNFFQEIKNLKEGDIILYTTQNGERKYKVIVNTVIEETNWSYIENTSDNRITLITCEENKREYRRCIQGIEIKT